MMTWERERGEGGQSRFLYHSPRQTQKRVDLYYSHAPHEEGNNYKSVEQKLTRSKIWCDLHNGGELTVKGSNMRINTFICLVIKVFPLSIIFLEIKNVILQLCLIIANPTPRDSHRFFLSEWYNWCYGWHEIEMRIQVFLRLHLVNNQIEQRLIWWSEWTSAEVN